MLKSLYLLVTVLFYLSSFSQTVSVANERENTFYVGVNNPVSIAVENRSCKKLIVKTSKGTISGSNCRYLFRSDTLGATDIIILRKKAGKMQEIGRSTFRIKQFSLPTFKIGSGKDTVSKAEIANQLFVRADLDNFYFDIKFNVVQFSVYVISREDGSYKEAINSSNKISEEVKNMFQALKANDIVVFSDIYASGPGLSNQLLAPRVIKIIR